MTTPTDRVQAREIIGEFVGTAVLMVPIAMEVQQLAGVAGSTIAWIIAVVIGILVASELGSAAHINPAVTVAFAAGGVFPWRKVPGYVLAQVLGAATAALVIRVQYAEVLDLSGYTAATQRPFATGPGPGTSILAAGLDQVIGTALLLFGVMVVVGRCAGNDLAERFVVPAAVGLHAGMIGWSMSSLAGASLNPARDLGPRLVASLTGWGRQAWLAPDGTFYGWIPPVAQFAGAIVGIGAYLVAMALPDALATQKRTVQRLMQDPAVQEPAVPEEPMRGTIAPEATPDPVAPVVAGAEGSGARSRVARTVDRRAQEEAYGVLWARAHLPGASPTELPRVGAYPQSEQPCPTAAARMTTGSAA